MYIFEGRWTKNDKFKLVSSKLLKFSGNQAKYKIDESNMIKGLRVKLTLVFSVIGTCAPLFATVICLNKRNLYVQKNISIRIKGLCLGGGGINIDNSTHSYASFMTKHENTNLLRYKYYEKNILPPFIFRYHQMLVIRKANLSWVRYLLYVGAMVISSRSK